MPDYFSVTTSNFPRLREPQAVHTLLDHYEFADDVGAWIESDEIGNQCLILCGEGWPRVRRLPQDPEADPIDELEATEETFDQLLKELSRYLADPLTVQAVGHDDCCFPFAAREWHVRPGCAKVEINDFDHSWDEESTQVPLAVVSTS